MAGLLGDVLPWVYSRSDALKRQVGGLLSDPVGTAQQAAGLLRDRDAEQQGLMGQAFGNPQRPFQVTDSAAMGQAASNMLMGPLGFAPAGIMAGVGAKTANKAALTQAQTLEKNGAAPDAIWQQTGWGKGPEGRWRFEIDDSAAKNLFTAPPMEHLRDLNGGEWIGHTQFMQKYPNTNEALTMRLRNTMYADHLSKDTPTLGQSFSHPTLMDAYPDLYKTRTVIKNDMPIGEGGYAGAHDALVLSPMAGKQADNVILHELQHAIQQREGFSQGGTPGQTDIEAFAQQIFNANKADFLGDPAQLMEMARHQSYERLAGEAEARLVQARMNMTAQQRAQQFPWADEYFKQATGVPLDSLIHR